MRYRNRVRARRGTFLPFFAVCVTALFAMVALAIDMGMLTVGRTQCQAAADAAALNGARVLSNKVLPNGTMVANNDVENAVYAAKDSVVNNIFTNANFQLSHIASIESGVYDYDNTDPNNPKFKAQSWSGSYVPSASEPAVPGSAPPTKSWTAMRVTVALNQDMFFAKVIGMPTMANGATAVAVHRPRDVAVVLDFSGSMGEGSLLNDPDNGSAAIEFLRNPDPAYPQFGHYGRYAKYSINSKDNGNASPGSRQNPLRCTANVNTSGPNNLTIESGGGPPIVEDFFEAPAGVTEVSGSTALTNAFKRWDASAWANYNPTTGATPAPPDFAYQSSFTSTYAGDKWPRNNGKVGPESGATYDWATVSGSTWTDMSAFTVRDFLYKAGGTPVTKTSFTSTSGRTISSSWLPTSTTGYNHPPNNTVDGGTTHANYRDAIWEAYGYDMDVKDYQDDGATKSVLLRGAADRFKGYSMGPGYWGKTFFIWPPDPRFTATAISQFDQSTDIDANKPAHTTGGLAICDWRRRFFLKGDGSLFNPENDQINQILFNVIPTNPTSDPKQLGGHVFNPIVTSITSGFNASNCPGYYRINYNAIMAWLKTGPQVFPTNLRSGRILYYKSMPDDLTITGTGDDALDRRWWREYIHYILGINTWNTSTYPLSNGWINPPGISGSRNHYTYGPFVYSPAHNLAGVEYRFPFSQATNFELKVNNYQVSTTSTTAPTAASFTPTANATLGGSSKPRPYMNYTDNINRPRMHLWFGGFSMIMFMELRDEHHAWWSGTVHEAQSWQLKASVNSALSDIRQNHPNDFCGIAAFAARNHFLKPLAPMSQDLYTLQNVLFFRKDTVADMKANLPANSTVTTSTLEHRPYNANFLLTKLDSNGNPAGDSNDCLNAMETCQIPTGNGSTDPQSGMAVAFNLLSSSTALPAVDYGTRGRRGAAKIVVFETDGQPNLDAGWQFALTGAGPDTRFIPSASPQYSSKTVPSLSGDGLKSAQAAIYMAERIAAPIDYSKDGSGNFSSTSGYSLPNTPARVYAIGFGDLFEAYTGSNYASLSNNQKGALEFLLRMQQAGNTSSGTTSNPQGLLPMEQIITGPYQTRIDKLKTAFERIMQSGVQVTLIE